MKCPQCEAPESAVIDSRAIDDNISIRRRRECIKCSFRFTTYERIEKSRLMVVKKNGTRELFDRNKLANGIYKAFYKRPIPVAKVEQLIDEVEREVYELNRDEICSCELGELVIGRIEKLDQVAYIRFAAVYREFADLKTFDDEIKKMIEKNKQPKA